MSSGGSAGRSGRDRVLALAGSIRWRAVSRDVLLVAAWVVAVSFAFRTLGWPTWAYYVVVFGGVVGYSLVGDPWAPRDSSP